MKKCKGNKGITLITLTVYIISLMFALAILALVTTYFRSNFNDMNNDARDITEYDKFHLHFLDETKRANNDVQGEVSSDGNIITFTSGNKYQFVEEEKAVYLLNEQGNIKITEGVIDCKFSVDKTEKTIITVNMQIGTEKRETKYVIDNNAIGNYEDESNYTKIKKKMPSTNETSPYLPDQATIIEDDFDEGITIKDANNNEWTWVVVPKSVTASSSTTTDIYNSLVIYASAYRGTYSDEWYEGCGVTETQYNTLKNNMLNSIKEHGGFWISKYEIGTDTIRISGGAALTTPLSQKNKYVYNYVTCSQAQGLASDIAPSGTTGSLLFGIQWDLVMKYLEENSDLTQDDLKNSSTTWGNYKNSEFSITEGKYSTNGGNTYTQVSGTYSKSDATTVLLTTGIIVRNSRLNIYDLAGSVEEWTLEKSSNVVSPCVIRGGRYDGEGIYYPANLHLPYSIRHQCQHHWFPCDFNVALTVAKVVDFNIAGQ